MESISVEKLSILSEKLKTHLIENGIEDAIIYEPHNPKEYWNPNNTRIAFCNEEPYSTDGKYVRGIRNIDSDMLDGWTDKPENKKRANPTISNTYFLNYCIRFAIENKTKLIDSDIAKFKCETEKDGRPNYDYKYEQMDKSLYFNYRYSIPTDTHREHKGYIKDQYKNDPFYAQHYKEFLEATNPEILVIGSKFGTELYTQIYPELQGKLTYCGEPVIHNGRLVISIPHPSIISDEAITDVVNKIVKNYTNIDNHKNLENTAFQFDPDKFIQKR